MLAIAIPDASRELLTRGFTPRDRGVAIATAVTRIASTQAAVVILSCSALSPAGPLAKLLLVPPPLTSAGHHAPVATAPGPSNARRPTRLRVAWAFLTVLFTFAPGRPAGSIG